MKPLTHLRPVAVFSDQFPLDVRHGLSNEQKWIPAEYLYDAVGSALFEAITVLPEYGLSRAETRILADHGADIAQRLHPVSTVIELGSGSGRKTRLLLEAMAAHHAHLSYTAIDLSQTALKRCSLEMHGIAGVTTRFLTQAYLQGLADAVNSRWEEERILVLMLGSSIGNFDLEAAASFLLKVRAHLRPGDGFLLGADLVKHPDQLMTAYDDPIGVTAAFNLNILARMNRELGANFQIRSFQHEARWSPEARRIEMHVVSQTHQSVKIPAAAFEASFKPGETIWTESSYKFNAMELARLARATGFRCVEEWTDLEWPFSESLWIAEEPEVQSRRFSLLRADP